MIKHGKLSSSPGQQLGTRACMAIHGLYNKLTLSLRVPELWQAEWHEAAAGLMIETKATEALGGVWQPGFPHILVPMKPTTCHIPTRVTWGEAGSVTAAEATAVSTCNGNVRSTCRKRFFLWRFKVYTDMLRIFKNQHDRFHNQQQQQQQQQQQIKWAKFWATTETLGVHRQCAKLIHFISVLKREIIVGWLSWSLTLGTHAFARWPVFNWSRSMSFTTSKDMTMFPTNWCASGAKVWRSWGSRCVYMLRCSFLESMTSQNTIDSHLAPAILQRVLCYFAKQWVGVPRIWPIM